MNSKIDSYVTLDLVHSENEFYKANLVVPFQIGALDRVLVAVCDLSYSQDPQELVNGVDLQFQIAIPKYCTPKPPVLSSSHHCDSENESEQETEEVSSSKNVKFIECTLENGEYTASTLCKAINSEIQSKFPSTFREKQCQLMYNSIIDRTELRIDGTDAVTPENERCCFILFNPALRLLGFTRSQDENANFIFGAPSYAWYDFAKKTCDRLE